MTIGVDVRVLLDRRQSGIAVYVRNILKHLVNTSGEVSFHLFAGGWKRSKLTFDSSVRSDRVSIFQPHLPNRALNLSMSFFGWPALDRLVGNVERFFLPHLLFAVFSPRCRYVVTVHDLSFLRVPDTFSWPSRLWHKTLHAKKVIAGASKIIAVSEHTKRDVVELVGVEPNRVVVIRSGVQPLRPLPLPSVLERFGIRQPYLLVLGNLEPRKNPWAILEAYKRVVLQIPEAPDLVFVGGEGWSHVRGFQSAVTAMVGSRVHLTGALGEADRDALLTGAYAVLYPSIYEGFGFPVLEAFSAGVPVITSSSSSMPEIGETGALLVDPNNVAELSEAIFRLCIEAPLRNHLVESGRSFVKKYTWESAAKKTLQILQEV